jgi:hypothetical protein
MVRKAIVNACTGLALILLLGAGSSAWAQGTPPDASKSSSSKTSSSYSSSTTSKPTGQTCGGIGALKCPEGEACRFPINQCNVADLAGVCVKVPATCKKGGAKVCGCNGTTYANRCELLKAGVPEAHKGACKKK